MISRDLYGHMYAFSEHSFGMPFSGSRNGICRAGEDLFDIMLDFYVLDDMKYGTFSDKVSDIICEK